MKEYIITKFDPRFGWSLHATCGCCKPEFADTVLQRIRSQHPEEQYRIEVTNPADCWWNDPKLAN